MRKQIFRVENADGIGPFQISATMRKTLGSQKWTEYFWKMPEAVGWFRAEVVDEFFGQQYLWAPTSDHPHHGLDVPSIDDYDRHVWKVGCKDMKQLNHWFPEKSYAFFAEWGFELVIYDCEYVHFGTYQVLFCTDDAVLVERKCLNA